MMPIQCASCTHYKGGLTCSAYKKKIPTKILTGVHDHQKPHKGDNGIRFEPIKDDDV